MLHTCNCMYMYMYMCISYHITLCCIMFHYFISYHILNVCSETIIACIIVKYDVLYIPVCQRLDH